MKAFYKNLRYYYWLILGFIKKNFKPLIINFIAGFFFLVLFINFFPYLVTILTRKVQKIGYVGRYSLSTLPPDILHQLSNPLLTINARGEIMPVLIKSYELLNNNKVYRFYLKPNLLWNDGQKLTTGDLRYKFKGVQTKIIDETTIEFELNQPLSTFPAYLTKPIFKKGLIGVAGVYEVQNYLVKNDDLASLQLSPNKKDLPHLTYRFYDTENKLITAYKKGEINFIKTPKKNIADLFSTWKNTKITKLVNYQQILTLFFNTNLKLLVEKDMRSALIYGLPPLEDFGVAASGPIPPLSWAYNPQIKKYPPDLDKATGLFKKLTEDQNNLEITLYTFYDYLTIAESIKKNYEKMGLKVNLKVLSYLPQEFDLLLTVWNPPQDPDQYYFWHSTQKEGNLTNYKNVKVDKLLEDGRKTINIEERKKIYGDFQKNLMEDLPAYFIYHPYVYTIEKK